MIRIDEVYDNIFLSYIQQHAPGLRIFYCDPPGHTATANLLNLNSYTGKDNSYVFFHDQEPVDIELFSSLFDSVVARNRDISIKKQPCIVVSELGENLNLLRQNYNWKPLYYFFHGWAALDWYRGYNRTYKIKPMQQRSPRKTFISPNRIIGGKRDHRVKFIYLCAKNNLTHNYISAPLQCPHEHVSIFDLAHKFSNVYPDIDQVLRHNIQLPKLYAGEEQPVMSSYFLSNLNEAQDSMIYVVTETVFSGVRHHLTEKIFRPIAIGMPFVLVSTAGSLEYIKGYGFKTFSDIWNEDYDYETDDLRRLEKIVSLLKDIDTLSIKERMNMFIRCESIVNYNLKHFYQGGFEKLLWHELQLMMQRLND